MRKVITIYILMMLTVLMLSMASCGGGAAEPEVDSSSSNEILFKDNVFENDKVKVEITNYEVIQPGDTTYNEYTI